MVAGVAGVLDEWLVIWPRIVEGHLVTGWLGSQGRVVAGEGVALPPRVVVVRHHVDVVQGRRQAGPDG